MVRLIEEYNSTKEERIKLIIDIIRDLENDDIKGISDCVTDQLQNSEVYDPDYNRSYYELSKDEAVENGYCSYLYTYFEDDEEGVDFVEEYYGDDTDTFYEELEEACKRYVSTFDEDDIDSFFEEPDDPLNPGNMDHYINGSGYSYKPPRYDRW